MPKYRGITNPSQKALADWPSLCIFQKKVDSESGDWRMANQRASSTLILQSEKLINFLAEKLYEKKRKLIQWNLSNRTILPSALPILLYPRFISRFLRLKTKIKKMETHRFQNVN